MSFFAEYGMFLIKTATIVAAILVIIATIVTLKLKAKAEEKGALSIEKINDHYDEMSEIINSDTQTKTEKKATKKAQKAKTKADKDTIKKRLFVLRFDGDIKASALSALREEITAILLTAKAQEDEVLIKLDSSGGLVNAYGLAASQLQRLRDANLSLTVAIDKMAASGGYMMACVANAIIAAPFSIIGSIGVIAQLPNFHRLLQKNHVDFEQITAGEYKRTLTVFGENTRAGREKLQDEVNEMHELFKTFVKTHRPQVDLDQVATGEHWFATQAIDKALVDKLQTSDDYLLSRKDTHDLYAVRYLFKQPFTKRFSNAIQQSADRLFSRSQTKQDYMA